MMFIPAKMLKVMPMSKRVPKDFAMNQRTMTEKAVAQAEKSSVLVLETRSAIRPNNTLPANPDPLARPRIKAPCSGVRPIKTA